MVVVEDPSGAQPAANFCLTDNEPMARYLVNGFMAHFAAFRGRALLRDLPYRPLAALSRAGDSRSRYVERASGDGVAVELTWDKLGQPYAVDMPPALTATGRHQMYSLFVDSDDAWCTVNGRPLPGRVVPARSPGARAAARSSPSRRRGS